MAWTRQSTRAGGAAQRYEGSLAYPRPGYGTGGSSDTGGTGGSSDTGGTGTGGGTGGGDPMFHLFLLLGQSNMAGYALAEEEDKVIDDRIQMLGYDGNCGREENQWAPAQPSLHDFINGCDAKVSPGDWFAKTIIERLPDGDTIGLIPAAFSGEEIDTFLRNGAHHDTIVGKIDEARKAPNAHFEGILFHQGESDSGDTSWPGKVKTLYEQMKEAMGIDYDIPFLAGELPYSGGAAGHNTQVALVADQGANFYVVSAEGLNVDPADTQWNLHFGHDDTVELGKRYAQTMAEALGW